ncbi:MAG TPA: NAD-dependent epimerase/dehydratase family protein [Chitinophagaceae bacterium]|nr:NAD-dependent epimerase/dehydratase family protein [Chitinophagaceae bacterium]
MRVFVTGATGFIGSRLVHRLHLEGTEINILVRNLDSGNLPEGKNIRIFKGDITQPETIAPAIRDCTHVYHCAAIAKFSSSDNNAFRRINVEGTRNILQASLDAHVEKLVFTSSAAVFGPSGSIPLVESHQRTEPFESVYDISKQLAENLVRHYVNKGLHAVIVNPSRVFGPGLQTYSNAVNRVIQQILNKKILLFPAIGKYASNYCYVEDVVTGHILAMEKGSAGENYILGGENISYSDLLASILSFAPTRNYVLKIPVPLLKGIAFFSQLVNKYSELTPSLIKRFAKNRLLNSDKAVQELGYRITPFDYGMATTIAYLIERGNIKIYPPIKMHGYGKDQVSTRTT